jgi:hypothetical protein
VLSPSLQLNDDVHSALLAKVWVSKLLGKTPEARRHTTSHNTTQQTSSLAAAKTGAGSAQVSSAPRPSPVHAGSRCSKRNGHGAGFHALIARQKFDLNNGHRTFQSLALPTLSYPGDVAMAQPGQAPTTI